MRAGLPAPHEGRREGDWAVEIVRVIRPGMSAYEWKVVVFRPGSGSRHLRYLPTKQRAREWANQRLADLRATAGESRT